MPCNNCHKRHYVTTTCRYFGGKKYDVYDCAFRVILKPSQINVKMTINFPAKMYYAYTFPEIPVRHGVDSFTNVHASTIYVYVEVVVHCMAGLLSYPLGCLVTTTYMQPNIPWLTYLLRIRCRRTTTMLYAF
jgi:hypothetical protein